MTVLAERVPVINKDAAFEHLHHRDAEGQFSAMDHIARMLRSLGAVSAGGTISPHDESDHNMDFSSVRKDGSVGYEVVGDQDDIQFDLPPGDLAKLHKTLTDSLEADDSDGFFQVDDDNGDRTPDVTIAWEKTRTFMGRQEYDVTFTHTTPETSEEIEVDGGIQTAIEDEETLTTTLVMSERDMRDWQIAMTITLLTEPALAPNADVTKALIATLTKNFDPDQPRDDHGRWSKIGAAISAVAEAVGHAVRAHATFGGSEGSSDTHGLVTMHDTPHGRVYALNLHDRDVGTSHVAVLAAEDSEELSEGLYEAAKKGRAGESGSIHNYVDPENPGASWWRLDYTPEGSTLHVSEDPDVSFDDDNNRQEVLLSHDDAESLVDALDEMRSHDPDNLLVTAPLPDGQTLGKRKTITGDERDLVLGVVSGGPNGDRLRLGLAGSEDAPVKRWTGGRGPMVADLGPDEARVLGEDLDAAIDQMKAYEQNLHAADDLLAAWDETPPGQRFDELISEGWSLVSRGDGTGHGREQVVVRLKPDAKWPHGREDYEPAPPEVDAEYRALLAERDKIWSDLGLVDEGETIETREVETPWGTVSMELRGNLLEYNNPTELRVSVRPNGVSADDFDPEEDRATLPLAGVKKLRKLVTDAFAADGTIAKSAGGTASRADNQRIAREGRKYWTRSPEGLAKWARSAHPWTKLYRHLVTKMDPETAQRLTSSYFKAVFGYAPSARQGKNPVGRG